MKEGVTYDKARLDKRAVLIEAHMKVQEERKRDQKALRKQDAHEPKECKLDHNCEWHLEGRNDLYQ